MKSQKLQANSHPSKPVSEWSGFRVAAPVIVFVTLMFANAQWVRSGLDLGTSDWQPQVENTDADAAYFPAQFAVPIGTAEAHIDSF